MSAIWKSKTNEGGYQSSGIKGENNHVTTSRDNCHITTECGTVRGDDGRSHEIKSRDHFDRDENYQGTSW
jgi:hypothetical protein